MSNNLARPQIDPLAGSAPWSDPPAPEAYSVDEFLAGKTPEEKIAWLTEQFNRTVALLRSRDFLESQIARRFEATYLKLYEQMKQTTKETVETYGAAAARYWLIREYQVQIWKLGIAASGADLDRAIDVEIKRRQRTHGMSET